MDKCLCKIYLWRLLKVWLYFLQSFFKFWQKNIQLYFCQLQERHVPIYKHIYSAQYSCEEAYVRLCGVCVRARKKQGQQVTQPPT